jgi:hypothetical protein
LPAYNWNPGYGGIPAVPNPSTTAGTATSGNLSNFPNLSQLASLTNLFNEQQQTQQLIRGLPNYSAMVNTASGNTLSELQGRVPQDVIRQMETSAAERGVGTGLGGASANNQAALLRSLGLTSLDLTARGNQDLTTAIGRTPQVPLFNPASFFVTPEQQQQAGAAASLYASAPDPYSAAQAAMQAARAGAGGGYRGLPGGGGYGPSAGAVSPSSYVRQPWASDLQTTFVGGATGSPMGPQEASPEGYQRWQDWANSLPGMGGGQPTDQQWADYWGFGDAMSAPDLQAGGSPEDFMGEGE